MFVGQAEFSLKEKGGGLIKPAVCPLFLSFPAIFRQHSQMMFIHVIIWFAFMTNHTGLMHGSFLICAPSILRHYMLMSNKYFLGLATDDLSLENAVRA
jgi:hypothetical protein